MLNTLYILAVSNPMIESDAAAAESGITHLANQFGVEWPLLIAQIANFCLVAFILYRFAIKPVLVTMEERKKKIADGLQYAEETKEKLRDAEVRYIETLKQASIEAQDVIHEAREKAKAHFAQETQAAVAKAESILRKAEESIGMERNQMLNEVKKEVASLVIETTEKVLSKHLSEHEKKLFNQSVGEALVVK